MGTNIADWIAYWDNFDKDLYIRYLIAKQNQENESENGDRENLGR
jgi:hypothetical protein